MRFKLGFVSGFASGYYLGSKAGRPRYEQINRALQKIRSSDPVAGAVDSLTDKARDAASKASNVLPHRRSNGSSPAADDGPNTIPAAAPLTGQPGLAPPPDTAAAGPYSSSR